MVEVISEIDGSLEKVRNGTIVQFPKFLQMMNCFDEVQNLTYEAIHKHAPGKDVSSFEKIHEVLAPEEILAVDRELCETVKVPLGRMIFNFIRNILQCKQDFYIDNKPIVRLFTPHDYFVQHKCLDHQGFLKIQGPHHDTWFGHSTEGLNVWMAVGHVRKGNGLSIYPDVWGRYINHEKHRMPRHERLGRPINFELGPGDLLFFHGEHLHSSELNVTNETRYVITNRFSILPPKVIDGCSAPWLTSNMFE